MDSDERVNGIFVLKEDANVPIDANRSTKGVIATLKSQGYSVTNSSSFYHQLRKKAGLLGKSKGPC